MTLHAHPQPQPRALRCANHPDREGVGVCVGCRAVVCVECSTRIDRMNYCIRCLQSAVEPEAEQVESPAREAALGIPLAIGGAVGATLVFFVLGYLLALLRTSLPSGVTPP
ncbi:MAG: hypothetical protein ACK47B_14285 [Armatimonadota bacterium]